MVLMPDLESAICPRCRRREPLTHVHSSRQSVLFLDGFPPGHVCDSNLEDPPPARSLGYPMRLSCDSAQFVHGTWSLFDEVTGSIVNVNLNAQSAVEILDARVTSLVLSYVSGTRTIGTTLRTGWNLVSVPLVVDDWSTTALFPGMLTPAYGFENSYVEKSIMETGKATG